MTTGIVVALATTTLVSIVAAASGASLVVHVTYEGPRPLAGTPECADAPLCVDLDDIHAQLLDASEGSAGYGYRFADWLLNGYGYFSMDMTRFVSGTEAVFEYSIPSGDYRVRTWADLKPDGLLGDHNEPFAFADTADGPTLTVRTGETLHAYASIVEVAAPLDGFAFYEPDVPAADLIVRAVGPYGDVHKATVRPDGSFTFTLPTGAIDALTYHVLVDADGYLGDSETIVVGKGGAQLVDELILVPLHETLDIPLPAGWSLVSVPVAAEDMRASALFGGLTVYGWNGLGYVDVSGDATVQHGRGYWVYTPTASTLSLTGIPQDAVTLDLPTAGWHLVGGPAADGVHLPAHANVLPPLFGWDANVGYVESNTLDQGEGYWLFTQGSATLEVSS